MRNYDMAALSSGFQNHLELQNINNNNTKNRTQLNNKMMSSFDLKKNKSKNINSNKNFNPSHTQYNFSQRSERNASLGNNALNYHLPRGGSQYNLNALKKMNNQLERENLNLMNENRSIKLPENNNINNKYIPRTNYPLSKQLNNNIKIRPFNTNTNKINTTPNENMILNAYNNNINNDNNYEEEENNDEDIDNIVNNIDEYYYNNNNNNNNNNNATYNIINENKALKFQINKLFSEKNIIEKKANDIIKVNEDILNENKLLNQKVNKYSNIINSYRSSKNDNDIINNKNQIIQKYMYEKNKLTKMCQGLKRTLIEKERIIKGLNQQILSLNEDMNKTQQNFNGNMKEENIISNYEKEIKDLNNIIQNYKKNEEEKNKNENKYLEENKSLKEKLEEKNKDLKEAEVNSQLNQQIIKDLKNKLKEYETNNKNLEKINKELKIQLNNKNENDINDSDIRTKINDLEENNDSLKKKNEELSLKLEEKNKEIELYKNKEENKNNIDYENLQQKYENALRDCENFKKINDILLDETNKYKKIISENDIEKEAMNKSLEILKQKNSKYENEIKRKTEKNPFKIGDLELDPIKKEEARYSLGAKEAKNEKYKKMILDYETQNKNDLNQMNMLKADIKGLKNRLKEKEKKLGEIKILIETGYKDINGKNKTQKDAIKRLKEILNNSE